MSARDVVVIGGSAGGLPALLEVAAALPAGLPAGVLVALHTPPDRRGHLPELLSNAGHLAATHAVDGDAVEHGHIYIAPPDRHLIVHDGTLRVSRGPREHGFRPAIDPLFRSAAETLGARVIGVILSGGMADGSLGLRAVKRSGGVAIVQDVEEALVPSMPLNAIRAVDVDHVLRAAEIGPAISELARRGGPARRRRGRRAVSRDERRLARRGKSGDPVALTCPECGGALAEKSEGPLLSFRCHTGHAFTGESLTVQQNGTIEAAFWSAIRALEEAADIRRRMARRTRAGRLTALAQAYDERAEEAEREAEVLRRLLIDGKPAGGEHPRRSARRG